MAASRFSVAPLPGPKRDIALRDAFVSKAGLTETSMMGFSDCSLKQVDRICRQLFSGIMTIDIREYFAKEGEIISKILGF